MHWSTLLILMLTSVMRPHLLHLNRAAGRRNNLSPNGDLVIKETTGRGLTMRPPIVLLYPDSWLLAASTVAQV